MKTNKFITLVLTVVASLAIVSCVQDDDYTIPSSLGDEENARLNNLIANGTYITIPEALALYTSDPNGDGNTTDAMPFVADENIYIKGYVSSSDKTGNFFKELFLQDSPTNPTVAIKVIINQVDLYNQFNFGREVYVSLKGVFLGEERVGNGITTIGGGTKTNQFGTAVTSMGENRVSTHVFRSPITEAIVPVNVTIPEINSDLLGIYVQVNGVEFADNLLGKRYFDAMEDFDTKRKLQSCDPTDYSTINLETSSFASFKNTLLPEGNGSLKAVVNKTFDGSSVVLAINATEDVNLDGERCTMASAIFSEDFESAVDNTDLNLPGWTNFSEAGSRVWREKFYQGNGYTEFAPFGSGQASNIGWLITPAIDITNSDNAFLNFKSAQHHLDQDTPDNILKVFVSTDFDGTNVLAATWNPISATLATTANGWREYVDSGVLDISAYTGSTLYVAFVAKGSGTVANISGAWMIDDLKILAD